MGGFLLAVGFFDRRRLHTGENEKQGPPHPPSTTPMDGQKRGVGSAKIGI